MLAELDKMDAGDRQFERLLAGFTADARAHIAFEEGQAWPVLREGISAERAREIGEKLVRESGQHLPGRILIPAE